MNSIWDVLRNLLRDNLSSLPQWRRSEYLLFFEIEAVLYIYEQLIPEVGLRSAKQAWTIISGYAVPQLLKFHPNAQAIALHARQQIRYVKTTTAWAHWLNWYIQQPAGLCLYRIEADGKFYQRAGVTLRQERISCYQQLMTPQTDEHALPDRPLAESGRYVFEVNHTQHAVDIPDFLSLQQKDVLDRTSAKPYVPRTSEPIRVDLDELNTIAAELDQKEINLQIEPLHHWQQRLNSLSLIVRDNQDQPKAMQYIDIDGLFHLVGALGVGKSTLIWLLVYYLTTVQKRHISIVMNTVVEAYQLARWLRLVGVDATPALGRNRASHAQKVGYANRQLFAPDRVLSPDATTEPLFRWMPKPCPLAALAHVDIPVGQEPCWQLKDAEGERYACPLLNICPVHQMQRDLAESSVWVLNPASFLYTRAPAGSNQYLFEAIYETSDLLIVDEADRVQANWDHAFAPTSLVLGAEDALLDWLHRQLGQVTVGNNRSRAARNTINRMTNIDDQANMLANRAYRLLSYGHKRKLTEWIENRQVVNISLFGRLLAELERHFPREINDAEQRRRKQAIKDAFRSYWKKPLRRESGYLASWLNRFLGGDESERRLRRDLDNWLIDQMRWHNNSSKTHRLLFRKLELAVILTALIKRIDDLQRQLPWLETELGGHVPTPQAPIPDKLIAAMPDPPLGGMLGLRASQHPKSDQIAFHAMRYRGVGRWLLLHFHELFEVQFGKHGPHVLLTSATSWLPNSVGFHLAQVPQAILVNQEQQQAPSVDIRYHPIQIDGTILRISGAQGKQERRLRHTVQTLALGPTPETLSDFDRELAYWKQRGEPRRLLLVVNSYEQANWVVDELTRIPAWRDRVLRLFPDESEVTEIGIRTREVETFHKYHVDILVAPLMAIQRGFNILDAYGDALLGTAFFLVRPFPPPYDLTPHVMSLNAWFLDQFSSNGRDVSATYGDTLEAVAKLRQASFRRWRCRMVTRGYLSSMDEQHYQEFLRDSFVVIWQTIGRMIRGGRPARTIFVDGAFADTRGKRHILRDWHTVLVSLQASETAFDQYLAAELYGVAWHAFDQAIQQRRI